MDTKGKGKAMSPPISIVESEDEDSSYRVSVISRGSGKEIGEALTHMDLHSKASTSTSTSSSIIFSQSHLASLQTLERRTCANWM